MDNGRQLFWQVKNKLISSGAWFVVQSYNAGGVLPAPGLDTWASYTDLKGTGGGGVNDSWILLQNTYNGTQICFQVSVTFGWFSAYQVFDPKGGFSGGTISARPTSSTEISLGDISILGQGPAGNPQFYAILWIAPDGTYTRQAYIYGGHCKNFIQFDQLNTTPDGWTANWLAGWFNWGSLDYTSVSNLPTANAFQLAQGSGGTFKDVLTPGPDTVTQCEGSLEWVSNAGSIPNINSVANGFSNQYIWIDPMGISKRSGVSSVNGFWGYTKDQWFTPSAFNDFDTMGDHSDFIMLGQMVVQWGLAEPFATYGLGLSGATTNYPTSRWYGRACPCKPGGNVAIKFFDAGIASLVGDALATKKNLLTSGNVYFVNNSASGNSDSNSGLDRAKPKATFNSAFTAASAGDIVALLSGHNETITSSITLNKAGLKVVGDGSGSNMPRLTCGLSAGNPMLDITAVNVMIAGIYFPASTNSAGIGRLRIGAAGDYVRNCYFECGANDTTRTIGLVTGAANVFITNSTFAVTAATPAIGIEVVNSVAGLFMDGVIFDGGSYGWTDFALKGTSAVTSLDAGVRIMNGSNVSFPTGTTGMFWQDPTTTGECRVEWTP